MEGHNTYEVGARPGRLGRLAHFTARYRWPVIATWIVLTLFGGYSAGQLSSRWYQSLAVPGKPAYEGSQRTLKAFGAGVRSPNTVVFHSSSVDVNRRNESRPAPAGDGNTREAETTSRAHDRGRTAHRVHGAALHPSLNRKPLMTVGAQATTTTSTSAASSHRHPR